MTTRRQAYVSTSNNLVTGSKPPSNYISTNTVKTSSTTYSSTRVPQSTSKMDLSQSARSTQPSTTTQSTTNPVPSSSHPRFPKSTTTQSTTHSASSTKTSSSGTTFSVRPTTTTITDTKSVLDMTMLSIFVELDHSGHILVTWVSGEPDAVIGYKITYRDLDSGVARQTATIPPHSYLYTLTDVGKNRKYIVCVDAMRAAPDDNGQLIRKCEYISTKSDSNSNLLLIVLVSVAVVVVAVIITVACCMVQRRPKQSKLHGISFASSESRLVDADRSDYFNSLSRNIQDLSENEVMTAPMTNIAYKLPPTLRGPVLSGAYHPTKDSSGIYVGRERIGSGSSLYASTSIPDTMSAYSGTHFRMDKHDVH
ncbi:hypothetical protein LSH36_123g03039 [Paralvinella palmiformis]|uniref:Fibronectin type-III domain-containing protein n=1 Tax=Paralvinella palmiformis TaxID=53620 RepID=A0AAD9JZB6_9ANNE|nr:hypothetical protein LSH36_123g03039 [Paralvinella palmiformis]